MARSDGTLRVFGAEQCRWGTGNTWCGLRGRNTATWTYFSQQSSVFLRYLIRGCTPFPRVSIFPYALKNQGVSKVSGKPHHPSRVNHPDDTNGCHRPKVKKSDGMIMRSARRLFRQISLLTVRKFDDRRTTFPPPWRENSRPYNRDD